MDKSLTHRIARFLRAALSGTVLLQGIFASWMPVPLRAADTMNVGVIPTSTQPPASITDLLASANPVVEGQISLSWTAPQGNVGGHPMPNWPVAAYIVQYATFSVDDLGGDTAAWWNASSSNTVFLQGPSFVPKAPGQMEADALSGLIPGTHYYFGIKSISQGGITSPIDGPSSTPGQQANAIATKFLNSSGTPDRPNGLTMTSSGGQFTVTWHAVKLDTHAQPIQIDHYLVSRYDVIGSSPTETLTVAPNITSFTDTVGGLTYFYRIWAISNNGNSSAASDYVDSSSDLNRYVIASEDINTRVVIPGTLAIELNYESNGTGDDYEIIPIHQPQNENTTTLKSYLFQVQNARTGQTVIGFAFSQAVADVQVSYALSGTSTIGLSQKVNNLVNSGQQAQAVAQVISLYWFNGSSFIRVGGTVLLQNQALMVTAKNLGLYEIQAVSLPTSFALTRGSPYPRVITPNGAENHRVFWFFDNPANDEVDGTIYDIRGAKVRDLGVSSQSPTANSLVWDGRDNRGAVVPSGVYLYKIQAGKERTTGTVVVAR